jgi:methyl-accepting chemotaxis protein
VRNLAQRSAAAAKEITALIGTSVEQVELGTRLADQTGSTMGEIVAGVQRVTEIMASIAQASHEQTGGIEHVNSAIGRMEQDTQHNAALVDETAAFTSALQEQSVKLAQVVSVFTLGHAPQPRASAPAAVPRLAVNPA